MTRSAPYLFARRSPPRSDPVEDIELFAHVSQAFDLRGTPYLIDAVEAIVDWFEHRRVRRHIRLIDARSESRVARNAELIALLRETDPGPARGVPRA